MNDLELVQRLRKNFASPTTIEAANRIEELVNAIKLCRDVYEGNPVTGDFVLWSVIDKM